MEECCSGDAENGVEWMKKKLEWKDVEFSYIIFMDCIIQYGWNIQIDFEIKHVFSILWAMLDYINFGHFVKWTEFWM